MGSGAKVFPDLDAALGAVKADAALVVSPSALHAEHAIRALEAGLAVMLEKPFALTVADARRVLAQVADDGAAAAGGRELPLPALGAHGATAPAPRGASGGSIPPR